MAMKLGSNLDLDKVVKNLGKKYKLVPHIDLAIGEGDFEWEFTYAPKGGDDAWHPSGDCTPSLYELYMQASDPQPRQIPASLYKTFMVGHFWHQYLQWIIEKKLGFCEPHHVEREGHKLWGLDNPEAFGEPRPYHWARGSADIAPCTIPGYGEYVIDFKTMNARHFAEQKIPDYYAAKWECQGNIYMDFFDLDRVLFIGICKDSPHDMKEFVFERNQPLIDAIYSKWKLVSQCLDEQVVPPVDEEVFLPLKGTIE